MHAIILAAGRGSRLAVHNPEGRPKCLMEFGGRSLLDRHLDILSQLGVRKLDLVIGYEADQIIDHVGKLFSRPDVSFQYNPRYEQGSVLSLLAASEALTSGEPAVVMDADVLYHPGILQALLDSDSENCYLLDRDFEAGDEPVKIAVSDGTMVEFRKKLPDGLSYDMIGESVGFFRFGPKCAALIAAECALYQSAGLGDAPHEEALRNVLLRRPDDFDFEDISGMPWIEIDFPEDVIRAAEEVLPAIRTDFPDF
jgi:choline kinase